MRFIQFTAQNVPFPPVVTMLGNWERHQTTDRGGNPKCTVTTSKSAL